MAQQLIELILLKQWASYIAIPIWLMDAAGDLVYYNEPAEEALGARFEEAGMIHAEDLAQLFVATDVDGSPLPNSDLPVVIALTKHEPAHRALRIQGLDGTPRLIEVTAFPIEGKGGRHLGAVAAFWENGEE